MNSYFIIFEFRTHISESLPDLNKELNFLPSVGMNIFIDEEDMKFPEGMPEKGWFQVKDIDYLMKDNIFVISLKELGEYPVDNS